jgi:hypothetical protein
VRWYGGVYEAFAPTPSSRFGAAAATSTASSSALLSYARCSLSQPARIPHGALVMTDTSVTLQDITGGKAWVVDEYDGEPLAPEHGRPRTHGRPAPLLLEERQVGTWPAAPIERSAGGLLAVCPGEMLPRSRRPSTRQAVSS